MQNKKKKQTRVSKLHVGLFHPSYIASFDAMEPRMASTSIIIKHTAQNMTDPGQNSC